MIFIFRTMKIYVIVFLLFVKQSFVSAALIASVTTNWTTKHVEVKLDVPILFYGNYYSVVYVSTDGVVNIGQPFTARPLKSRDFYETRMLVPYHAEVYLNRIMTVQRHNNTQLLDAFSQRIDANFRRENNFTAKELLVVTWKISFGSRPEALQTVTFEMGSDGKDTFFTMLYQKSHTSHYQPFLSFIYGKILVGFSAGDGVRAFQMFGGGKGRSEAYKEILSQSSNVNYPGLWAFGFVSNQNFSVLHPHLEDITKNGFCEKLAYRCHSNAICSEERQRCECKQAFIGNGISCLPKGDFVLLTGSVNGKVDIHQLLNLENYVFVNQSSGMITVSITPVEKELGLFFRSVVSANGLFAWMFAQTSRGKFNGPDLHGDRFLATTVIQFNKDPRKTVVLTQKLKGYVAGRMQMETHISGSTIDLRNVEEHLSYIRNTSETYHHIGDGVVSGEAHLKLSPYDEVHITRLVRFEPLGIDMAPEYQIEMILDKMEYSAITGVCSVTFKSRFIQQREADVILVQSGSLKQFSIPYEKQSYTYLFENYTHILIGADYDCQDGYVYFTDATDGTIKRLHPNNPRNFQIVVGRLSFPEGIAVDWVHRNIYWTDSTTRSISRSTVLGSQQRVLLNTNISNPRSIVVHPTLRKLFWSDWDRKNPRIEETDLDGRSRSIFAGSQFVSTPNGIAINYETNELCWTDAGFPRIACAKFNERNFQLRVLVEKIGHPFSLSILDNRVLWTDWESDKVNQVSRHTKRRLKGIVPGFNNDGYLYDIIHMNSCPF